MLLFPVTPIAFLSLLFSTVPIASAHGFMSFPTPRDYQEISFAIDNLRNPNVAGTFCRGKLPEDNDRTPLSIVPGESLTVQLAISVGAEHVGYCGLELYDTNNVLQGVLAENVIGCASTVQAQCERPSGLVTGDMCIVPMTVQIPDNLDINIDRGFIRWTWVAQHVTPNESYEVCADIILQGNQSTPQTTSSRPTGTSTSTSPTHRQRLRTRPTTSPSTPPRPLRLECIYV